MRINELETERRAIETRLPLPDPQQVLAIHPKTAQLYERRVAEIHRALTKGDEAAREAVELVRELIDRIVVTPTDDGEPMKLELVGNVAALLEEQPSNTSAIVAVAGPRNHLCSHDVRPNRYGERSIRPPIRPPMFQKVEESWSERGDSNSRPLAPELRARREFPMIPVVAHADCCRFVRCPFTSIRPRGRKPLCLEHACACWWRWRQPPGNLGDDDRRCPTGSVSQRAPQRRQGTHSFSLPSFHTQLLARWRVLIGSPASDPGGAPCAATGKSRREGCGRSRLPAKQHTKLWTTNRTLRNAPPNSRRRRTHSVKRPRPFWPRYSIWKREVAPEICTGC
jgi:hypothetical protein